MGLGQAYPASLSIQHLCCMRSGRLVLDNINLSLTGGQMAWVKGPNGCGKSTLLRCISGLIPAFDGEITYHGIISLHDGNAALDEELSVENALKFWANLDDIAADKLAQSAEIFGLGHIMDIPVHMLSTGQRQRAALTRTICGNADIWLLDEPYNGLDQHNVAMLNHAIKIHLDNGGMVIITSHNDIIIENITPIILDLS
ncbi:heme ABC exporter, ATP-binding protein CcmA [Sphingorhabdus lutea]|uniref:Heme ABC exporter, ATP-binding protein CcmA n=1 Tax=Sphingorhabdus lutea TaxID=1913578 RepID=A0A1L3JDH0_9SPHN|nr:heme ABC exporter ATP-binding protein CcmA [Sphingorhabdus lutea]APG63093.1 heme ABC exporter, ATP-binding protein CcmA [Sphingorhabdus lutea]